MKKIGEIYVTENYTQFKVIESNRTIDAFNVQNIVDSMREEFLITIALMVKKEDGLYVLDGQHRLQACAILKKPFYFCIVDNLGNNPIEISALSLPALQNTKKWQPRDYVHYYASMGNEHYKIMEEFLEATGLPPISASICLTGTTGVGVPNGFKLGRFKVKDYERGVKLAEIVNKFKDTVMKGSATNPRFVSALFRGLMRHTIKLEKLLMAAEKGLPVIHRWVGSSVSATLLNLEAYSHIDRGLHKKHVDFNNKDWPYTI